MLHIERPMLQPELFEDPRQLLLRGFQLCLKTCQLWDDVCDAESDHGKDPVRRSQNGSITSVGDT